jgi:hypothetical protein
MSAARVSSVAGEKDSSKVSSPHHAGNYDHECDTPSDALADASLPLRQPPEVPLVVLLRLPDHIVLLPILLWSVRLTPGISAASFVGFPARSRAPMPHDFDPVHTRICWRHAIHRSGEDTGLAPPP